MGPFSCELHRTWLLFGVSYIGHGSFLAWVTSDMAPFWRELHRTWLLFDVIYIGHGSFLA